MKSPNEKGKINIKSLRFGGITMILTWIVFCAVLALMFFKL